MRKRLVDLNPSWVNSGGEGITVAATGLPAPERNGIGIICDCPCGCDETLFVPFANPLDGGPSAYPNGWQRTGDTFETLTLAPSIQRRGRCTWHGHLRNGVLESC